MRKILQITLMSLCSYAAMGQVNVGLTATASQGGGGVTTYGPQNYNDGIIPTAPATLPWGWVNTSSYIDYTWTTPQSGINKIKFWKADRPFTTCNILSWNGTAFVTVGTFTSLAGNPVDSFMFVSPITTTILRMDVLSGSSNPNFREIEVFAGNPCAGMTAGTLTVTNITSTSATVGWGSMPGSAGYDYIVDVNATVPFPNTPTTVPGTTANVSGLTPATTYYLHARNRCNSTDFSPWVDKSFVTYPPCSAPKNFKTTNLLPNSTTINWDPWPLGVQYDYIVDQSNATPSGSTGAITTSATSASVPGLLENTKYYVHLRTHCSTNETSGWGLDSFVTPIPCRAPSITIEHVGTDEAVAYWEPIPTSLFYEYAITTSATPPTLGTKYNYTSIHTSALQDGKEYFVHVRSTCISVGVTSVSPWGTASFKTFAVGINQTANSNFRILAYPNPITDLLTIDLKGANGKGTIIITDIVGKVVKEATVDTDKTSINMADLSTGTYLLKYADKTNKEIIKINKQ